MESAVVSVDVSLRSEKRITVHCPELILHIMKSRDQTSALLSVVLLLPFNSYSKIIIGVYKIVNVHDTADFIK